MPAFEWTKQRVALLTMYREIRMSYGWIANEMDITRNMVAGKCNRLKRGAGGRIYKRKLACRRGYRMAMGVEQTGAING